MTEVNPFAGLRYNLARIGNLADVISPPYDKISPQERDHLWQTHEHNVVKLILPPPGDAADYATHFGEQETQDWYSEAAKRLKQWIRDGIFQVDFPQYYVYRQTYAYEGVVRTRTGIFAALQLGESGGPHAHERTFEGPKADRLKLIRAAKTNLSPIFLLADGARTDWEALFDQSSTTLFEFQDREGQHHSLHSLVENDAVARAAGFLRDRTLVIADGHHRYETAQNYCREMQQATGKDPREEPWGSVMALIVPIESPGLLVLPTHRVVSALPAGWLDRLLANLADACDIIPLPQANAETVQEWLGRRENEGSVIVASGTQGYLLRRKPAVVVPALERVEAPLRGLNVTLLHRFIFEQGLGVDEEFLKLNTRYIRGEEQALQLVRDNAAAGVFLLRGIPPQDVFQVSQQGVRMPQKSTDFYPKIPTGLLLRSVDSDSSE